MKEERLIETVELLQSIIEEQQKVIKCCEELNTLQQMRVRATDELVDMYKQENKYLLILTFISVCISVALGVLCIIK